MSQRKTTRVIKKKVFPGFVEGPTYPSPPKKFKKATNTVASNAPGPYQQPPPVKVTTSSTTGPKDAPGKLNKPQLVRRKKYPESEDLFGDPQETSSDLSKSGDYNPSSPDSDLTRISSESPATPQIMVTPPLHTSTPADDSAPSTPVEPGRATARQRSPVRTRAHTPQAHRGQTTRVVQGRANVLHGTPPSVARRLSGVARRIISCSQSGSQAHRGTRQETQRPLPSGSRTPQGGQQPVASAARTSRRGYTYPMTEKKFQRVVVETLMDILDELKNINRGTESVEEGATQFPLKSVEEVEDMSDKLKQHPNLQRSIIRSMSRLGGKDLSACVRRVTDRLFTNALQREYNLMGGGRMGKRGLKKTPFFSVIVEAVRVVHTQATEDQIGAAVGHHLKQAPVRKK